MKLDIKQFSRILTHEQSGHCYLIQYIPGNEGLAIRQLGHWVNQGLLDWQEAKEGMLLINDQLAIDKMNQAMALTF